MCFGGTQHVVAFGKRDDTECLNDNYECIWYNSKIGNQIKMKNVATHMV